MRKLLALVLISAALISACGGDNDDPEPTTEPPQTTQSASPTQVPEPTTTSTATSAPTPTVTAESPQPTTQVPAENHITIEPIGVDAPLRLQVVGSDGTMGGTDDPDLVEIYDFGAFDNLGGTPGVGNTVVSGNQQEGAGSFINLGAISNGDLVTLAFEGETYEYRVVILCEASIQEFEAILATTDAEALTLIQAAGGTQTRVFAVAERQPDSLPKTCPAGTAQ